MCRLSVLLKWVLAIWPVLVAVAEDTLIDVVITRGTNGLGVHLDSEARGKGAVIDRVVPDSAASHSLRVGDVLTKITGVDVKDWSLDNINRLLGSQQQVRLQVRRPPEPRLHANEFKLVDKDEANGGGHQAKAASCYASVEGDTDNLHAFACTPASFGADLPPFSADGRVSALPVVVAQPLELCTRTTSTPHPSPGHAGRVKGGFALLVSRGGCLPGVKVQNAALYQAEVMILVDGQFPPLPPLPSVSGAKTSYADLSRSLLAHSRATRADFPVLVVSNSTGHRIISEARDLGREVVVVAHAGTRPSRLTRTPGKQIPLADSERLRVPDDAFNLVSSFRDGQMLVNFGEPGPRSGDSPTTSMQVPVELDHLLTGARMRIPFGRTVKCPVCGGRGATAGNMRPCKFCSSSDHPGVSAAKHDHSPEVHQTLKTTCSHCHGFGEVAEKGKACPRCKGERIVNERAWLELTISKGAPDGHTISFPGVGSHLPGLTAGNVEVVLKTEPHERFTREGSNLRMEIPISLPEALSGFTRSIQLLNGTLLALNKTGVRGKGGTLTRL
eukprot:g15325.t1